MKLHIFILMLLCSLLVNTNTQAHCADCNDEEIVDIVFDIGCIAFDVFEIVTTGQGYAALAADLGCAVIPGASGGGAATRVYLATQKTTKVITKFHKVITKPVIVLSKKAEKLVSAGKIPRMRMPESHIDDMYKHIMSEHRASATTGKSMFANVDDFDEMDGLFQAIGEAVNKGKGKMYVDVVGEQFSYTMYINMGKTVGTKGETWVALFYIPGGSGFIGSCFPISFTKANSKLLEYGF